LSEAQITWAISNYYKDKEEDFEKYKIICRFTNPKAAYEIWDKPKEVVEEISDEFLQEIRKHTKSNLDDSSLRQRLLNPEQYGPELDDGSLDTIERV